MKLSLKNKLILFSANEIVYKNILHKYLQNKCRILKNCNEFTKMRIIL